MEKILRLQGERQLTTGPERLENGGNEGAEPSHRNRSTMTGLGRKQTFTSCRKTPNFATLQKSG